MSIDLPPPPLTQQQKENLAKVMFTSYILNSDNQMKELFKQVFTPEEVLDYGNESFFIHMDVNPKGSVERMFFGVSSTSKYYSMDISKYSKIEDLIQKNLRFYIAEPSTLEGRTFKFSLLFRANKLYQPGPLFPPGFYQSRHY